MKITNNHNLPDAFLNFARDDKYSRGKADISVTTLIDGPRIRLMKDLHDEEIETDVVDMIWALFGTAVHHVLESADDPANVQVEERLYAEIANWTLSGALDHQEVLPDGTVQITDYKVTSAWSVILGKVEWERQQNCYAWLVENSLAGANRQKKVSKLRICAILRDWQRRRAQFDKEYPQSPIVIVELPLWSEKEREDYIYDRIDVHQSAQMEYDLYDKVPLCSDGDQWAKPNQWAVKEKGKKRALKLWDSEEDANEHVASSDKKLEIEFRKGDKTRCEGNYCNVAEFCEQFKGWRT
ncbi:MAG: hypothetical protein HOJ88_02335 [Proteobacteria bacterium]|jgi:hypothetical protein|nr:hypothetical protein [Pseudomonadota bacterium]